jgi:hypothetical protein
VSFADAALLGVWLVVLVLFCSLSYIYAGLRTIQHQLGMLSAGGNDLEAVGPHPGYELTQIADIWPPEIDWDANHVLLFAEPTCVSCHEILAELEDELRPNELTIVVPGAESIRGSSPFPELQGRQDLFLALHVRATPMMVQIGGQRIRQVGTAGNRSGARRLIERMKAGRDHEEDMTDERH